MDKTVKLGTAKLTVVSTPDTPHTDPAGPHADPSTSGSGSPKSRLVRSLAAYTAARLALVVVLAAVILYAPKIVGVDVPLIVAAIFAVLIAMPASLFLFTGLRKRVNADIADVDEQRRQARASLESRLRGEAG